MTERSLPAAYVVPLSDHRSPPSFCVDDGRAWSLRPWVAWHLRPQARPCPRPLDNGLPLFAQTTQGRREPRTGGPVLAMVLPGPGHLRQGASRAPRRSLLASSPRRPPPSPPAALASSPSSSRTSSAPNT